jgi:hypothetical protein
MRPLTNTPDQKDKAARDHQSQAASISENGNVNVYGIYGVMTVMLIARNFKRGAVNSHKIHGDHVQKKHFSLLD